MKKTILSIVWLLIATVSSGKAETNNAFETISVNQTTTHHSYQSQSNPSLLLNGDKTNAINEGDENHKPPAKSKHKRQLGLKIFGGVVVAYGLLVVLSVIFGPLFPYK
jgi:hypothetical protein